MRLHLLHVCANRVADGVDTGVTCVYTRLCQLHTSLNQYCLETTRLLVEHPSHIYMGSVLCEISPFRVHLCNQSQRSGIAESSGSGWWCGTDLLTFHVKFSLIVRSFCVSSLHRLAGSDSALFGFKPAGLKCYLFQILSI